MKSSTLIHVVSLAIVALAISYSSSVFGQAAPAPVAPPAAGAPGTLTAPTFAPVAPTESQQEDVRVIQLKHAEAASLANQLKEAIRTNAVADGRTNQLIIRGIKTDLDRALDVIKQLDVAAPERPAGTQNPPLPAPVSGIPGRRATVRPPPSAAVQSGSGTLIIDQDSGQLSMQYGPLGPGSSGGELGGGWTRLPNTYSGSTTVMGGLPEAVAQQLREADAAAKVADAQLKQITDLLQQAQAAAKSGKTDETAALNARLAQLVEEHRRIGEEQRRKMETYRRALEANRAAVFDIKKRAANQADPFARDANPSASQNEQRVRDLVVRIRALDQNMQDAKGYVKIVHVETGKMLGILNDNTQVLTNDTALEGQAVLAKDETNEARQWRIEKDADGELRIVNRKSGQVLDLRKSIQEEGAEIIQWPEWQPKFGNQRWEWVGDGSERRLRNKWSGMVLDIVDDGRIVQKRLDPNSKSQLWRVVDINSEHGADETDKQLAQYKEDLKAELTRQFDERQKAMADELKQLRQRLEKLEKQINDRQNSRQSFIERSLNDALSSIQQATANIDQTPHPLIITIPNGETRIINGSVMIDPASGAAEPIFAESPEHDHGDGAVGRPQLPPKY